MKFLRLKDVMEKTGLSRSAIYRKIKEREFPASVPIGSRTVAWLESDVEKWLEWRVQVRDRVAKGFFDGSHSKRG